MNRYRVTIGGQVYDVDVEDARARPVVARIGDEIFAVEVNSGAGEAVRPRAVTTTSAKSVRLATPAPAERGKQSLPAPIPGLVTEVAVAAGQEVEPGDPIVTIEAMKMFNVIRSPRAGTIAAVHVAERARVSQGDILVTFRS